jgi:homospermidine synthase
VGGKPYCPTVHYAYHPCDAAVLSQHEIGARGLRPQPRQTVLTALDVVRGSDGLGVLLMGNRVGNLWYGSRHSSKQARATTPNNTATTLQVVAAVAAGMRWAVAHPQQGMVEADELPHAEIVGMCRPYMGEMVAAWTDWSPLP